jgi:ketosteroid isomerase-like protein
MNSFLEVLNARPIAMVALALAMSGLFTLGSTARAQSDEEAAVRDVLTKNASAFERSDMATLNKLWANDESVTVFESGHANYGWVDYRDNHLKPEMAEMKNTKYAITDIKPRIAGNTAWATFKYAISAQLAERPVEANGLGTAVLEKRDGRWQIVHWHTSSPRRAPAASPAAKKP